MESLRAILYLIPIAACFVAVTGPTVRASHLRDAASEYKSAVKQFEIEIYERDYDRHSKRIVQDLEEAAIRMRSASSDLHRMDRLGWAWQDIQQLHPRVEAAFFGASRTCLLEPDFALVRSWQRVNFALGNLAQAVDLLYESYGAAPAASHLSPYPAAGDLHFPYGGTPHGPGFQAFPSMPSLPGELRSSGRGDLPHIILGSQSPRTRAPLPLDGLPMRPTFPSTPFDARSSYLAEPRSPIESRSVPIRKILRRLISELDN